MIQWLPTATDIRAAQTSLSGLFKKKEGGSGKEGDRCIYKISKNNKKITLDEIIPLL